MATLLSDARRGHPGLYWFAATMAALTLVTIGLAAVDHRMLLGVPLWFKPMKFAISLSLYTFALAWMLGQLREPAMRRTGWLIVAGATLEMVIIVGQAARGVRSHFNGDSTFDVILFAVMGVTITLVWLATLTIALRFLREPGRDRAMALAIRLGLLVSLVGMAVGFIMAAKGSHAVGLPDGGPGLPFVGWSTVGGDLRVGHFVGLHALQVLPLLAAVVAGVGVPESARVRAVVSVAAGYLGLVLLLTWQALRAQPVLAPDALTLGTLAVIVLGTAAGVVPALRRRAEVS
jgi:hypothetical protein